MIRVNSRNPITLEFPGCLVSVYEENGLIFQRVERQAVDTQTQEPIEMEADDEDETQCMEDEIQPETQLETQLPYEETQIGEPPVVLPASMSLYQLGWRDVMGSQEMSDLEALDQFLFG